MLIEHFLNLKGIGLLETKKILDAEELHFTIDEMLLKFVEKNNSKTIFELVCDGEIDKLKKELLKSKAYKLTTEDIFEQNL